MSTGPSTSVRTDRFRSSLRDSPCSEGDETRQQQPVVPELQVKDRHVDPAAVSVSRIERSLRYTALVSSSAAVVQATKVRGGDPASSRLAALLKDTSLVVSYLDISSPRTPPNALTGQVADGSRGNPQTNHVVPSPPSNHSVAKQPQGKIPRMAGMPSVMPTLPPAAGTTSKSSTASPNLAKRAGPKLNDALQLVAEATRALPVKAVSLLEAALLVDKDCLLAKAELGFCLLYGHGTHTNVNKALQLFDQCMACGHPGVLLTVGKCLRDGVGVPMDLQTSIQWIYKSANMGYLPAMHELGELYEEGISIKEVSPSKARGGGTPPLVAGGNNDSSEASSSSSSAPSMQTMVLDKDLVQSYRWYKNAAEQGYAESQLNLAKLYMLGSAEGADAKVDHWLKQAAKNGSLEAAGLLQRRN